MPILNNALGAGFTNVQFEGNDAYRAINADGYEVSLQYDTIDENASGSVENGTFKRITKRKWMRNHT